MPSELPGVTPLFQGLYRISRRGREPFAPPPWEYAGYGRYDDPRILTLGSAQAEAAGCFRSIYVAGSRRVAFREVLQDFRPRPELVMHMRLAVAEDGLSGINEDLAGGYDIHNGELRGIVHADWRWNRTIAHIYPAELLYADLTQPAAWTRLVHVPSVQETLVRLNVQSLDLSSMTGELRELSQEIARYIHDCTDDQGRPLYAGIRFHSRFGSGDDYECWALFDDRLEGSKPGNGRDILVGDPDLVQWPVNLVCPSWMTTDICCAHDAPAGEVVTRASNT